MDRYETCVELVFNNKHPCGVKMPEYARVCVCATHNIFKVFLSMTFQVQVNTKTVWCVGSISDLYEFNYNRHDRSSYCSSG